jgi:CHASE2 domain-containing sensor protein
MKKKLLYIGGALTLIWGIAHLFPTAGVVKDFGDISHDNKLIITMEWIIEGVVLIYLGLLTIFVTKTDSDSKLAKNVYISIISTLFVLAIVSLFTGFRIDFIPFRLCPVIFSISAILIIAGMKLKSKTQ